MYFTGVQALIDRIIASKSFGRSVTYANLLRYLVECSERGDPPKEIDIATDILGKSSYDSTQSSLVRVHVYKLRKKLARYYAEEGAEESIRLRIPKGSYAIEFKQAPAPVPTKSAHRLAQPPLPVGLMLRPPGDPNGVYLPPSPQGDYPPAAPPGALPPHTPRRRRAPLLLGGLLGIALGSLLTYALLRPSAAAPPAPTPPAFWAELLANPRPKQLVIGDLLVYQDSLAHPNLAYRNGGINSLEELADYRRRTGQEQLSVLSYGLLIRNSAVWVKQLTELFGAYGADYTIGAITRFNPREIGSHDLIVAGMLKTHGLFRAYFPAAAVQLTDANTLVLTRKDGSQRSYTTSGDPDRQHVDYGLIRRVRGPNGNTLVLAGGIWDTASSQMVKNLTQPELLAALERTVRDSLGELPPAFEILYRVEGIDRMELGATEVVYVGRLK